MKRTMMYNVRWMMFLLLVGVFNVQMAFAQNDAMYVYRNDGEFNAFFKSDIDSIAQSHYDADSVYHTDWQMQVIYTQDSIYRIPLAVIDSVSLITPQVILNDKVFELTAAHDPYLSECDTICFTLSLDTPSQMCPSNGNIVVSNYDCISFPDGIMARVLYKTQDKKGIHYKCKKVGLEDVYDQLIFIGEGYIEDPEASSRRKADPIVHEEELWNKEWIKTLERGGTTTTLKIGDAARLTVMVNIQKAKLTYFKLDLQNELTSSVTFNATSSFEKYFEKEIAQVTFPRIRIPQCPLLFITPKLKISGYFAEGATVSLDCSAHFNRTDKVSFELKDKKWNVSHTPINDAGVDVASISMTGYMEVGLIPDLFFSLCGSATGLGIETSVGIKESVDFKFDAVAAFDEDMYSALKDSYARTTLPWSVRAYVQKGMLGDSGSKQPLSIKISGEPQIGTDKYLLPLFTKPEYKKGTNLKQAILKTQPSRDLLLPVKLGIALYENDTKLETKYVSQTYRNQKDWTLDGVRVVYNNVETDKNYTAYPIVKIMDKALRAVPSTDFQVQTWTCPDGNHPHAIDLGLPSGTKWACCNVGASMPEDHGGYYAWGETRDEYLSDDLNIVSNIAGTKYDAATVNWGSPWQMPSLVQIQELINNTTSTWITQNGVIGRKFIGKNGGTIFLPAGGHRYHGGGWGAGEYGIFYSSTPYDKTFSYGLGIDSVCPRWGLDERDRFRSVRPVCK